MVQLSDFPHSLTSSAHLRGSSEDGSSLLLRLLLLGSLEDGRAGNNHLVMNSIKEDFNVTNADRSLPNLSLPYPVEAAVDEDPNPPPKTFLPALADGAEEPNPLEERGRR